jgi:hypothetical protein
MNAPVEQPLKPASAACSVHVPPNFAALLLTRPAFFAFTAAACVLVVCLGLLLFRVIVEPEANAHSPERSQHHAAQAA